MNLFRSSLHSAPDPKETPHEREVPEEPEVPNLPTEPDEPDFGAPITSKLGIKAKDSQALNYLTNEDGNEDPGSELDMEFSHHAKPKHTN